MTDRRKVSLDMADVLIAETDHAKSAAGIFFLDLALGEGFPDDRLRMWCIARLNALAATALREKSDAAIWDGERAEMVLAEPTALEIDTLFAEMVVKLAKFATAEGAGVLIATIPCGCERYEDHVSDACTGDITCPHSRLRWQWCEERDLGERQGMVVTHRCGDQMNTIRAGETCGVCGKVPRFGRRDAIERTAVPSASFTSTRSYSAFGQAEIAKANAELVEKTKREHGHPCPNCINGTVNGIYRCRTCKGRATL